MSQVKKVVLCAAPHADDESLGCGGALLRHVAEGDEVHWLLFTEMQARQGFEPKRIAARKEEIRQVARAYGFAGTHALGFPTMELDTVPQSVLVGAVSKVVMQVRPNILYLPYRYDAHSDHTRVFDAVVACSKSFRYPSVQRVLAYETLSETEFGLRPGESAFKPNHFVNIQPWLETKLSILRIYSSEMGAFPFPRSEECVLAQGRLRGSQAGLEAAEAFILLKDIRP
ncbi:GlcNAc-PI de-N-acetylase [Chromobacterium violaceum]|uniref:PIG-L deacetylase family protein n=1 Tax=Chromobacterium violaceum TaxID=536 RepID=UPI0009D9D26A|nr:PIG-L deacetylase family protein [Chromobacterium violaceum]OQS08492.1 GlcNAc-PI de-N-acetylase [Chromobacterium violaceum]OQS21688.1 GlcNAc-PI de-N-acetylase [Chromobacterium violaceum]